MIVQFLKGSIIIGPAIGLVRTCHSLATNVTVSVVSVGLTYNYLCYLVKPSCYDKYIMLRIYSVTVRVSVHQCGHAKI